MQTDIYNVLARCYVVTKVYKVRTVYVIQSLLVGLMSMFTIIQFLRARANIYTVLGG